MGKAPTDQGFPGAEDAELLSGAAQVLAAVDSLPRSVSGVLSFGEDGLIMVEDRKICWAVAHDMEDRLTELLSQQRDPPVPREALERVYRRCKDEHVPLGTALVQSGLVPHEGVRTALGQHHAAAIARLAMGGRKVTRFARARGSQDDRRFTFSTAEALASLAPDALADSAERARTELASLPIVDAHACAFQSVTPTGVPAILAVDARSELGASELMTLARWAAAQVARARAFDRSACITSAVWPGANAVVAWQDGSLSYVALCRSRPASTLLLSELFGRLARPREEGTP